MRHRVGAIATGLVAVTAIAMTGLLTAASPARAAEPIIVGTCATAVQGEPGQPISISPRAVMQPLVDIITAVPVLGPPLAEPFREHFAAKPPIPVGIVLPGDTVIPGSTVASAVYAALTRIPLLGPILGSITNGVHNVLSTGCRILVHGTNAIAAPVQDGLQGIADSSEGLVDGLRPGTPPPTGGAPESSPGAPPRQGAPEAGAPAAAPPLVGAMPFVHPLLAGWSYGRSPMADYSSIPYAKAGLFVPSPGVRYGGALPGYSPEFGILGTDSAPSAVNAAGRAETASAPAGGVRGVELPILLAVLALSGVTATLVRTWVLRRATAS